MGRSGKFWSVIVGVGGFIAAAIGFLLGRGRDSRPSINQGVVDDARRRRQDEIESTAAEVLMAGSVDAAAHGAAVDRLKQEFRRRAGDRLQVFLRSGGGRSDGGYDG